MKKYLFILSVATLGFAACSNDDVVAENNALGQQPKEIAFAPLAQASTRSGAQTGTFPTAYNMYVAAFQSAPNSGDYFNGTEFVNFETGHWHGSESRYWPLAVSTINFLGVTAGPTSTTRVWGEDTNDDATPDANWAKTVVVTMADNKPSEGVQHDMMWAIGQGSVTQGSAGAALTFPTTVAMEYQHTLALVKFTEKVTSTASGKIKLTSITLNDAYYNGKLTISNAANYNITTTPNVASVTAAWSDLGSAQSVVVPGWAGASSALTNTSDYSAVGDGLMIVPPTSAAAFSGFTVTYEIKDPDADTWKSYTYTYTPTEPSGRVLAQGYQYTYNITFNLNEIVIAPTVDTWETGTGQNITIQ